MSVEKIDGARKRTGSAVPFFQASRHTAQNLKDIAAVGLWSYLMSLPEDWVIYKQQVANHFGIGRDKVRKLFNILEEHGLIGVNKERDQGGKFTQPEIILYQTITPHTENKSTVGDSPGTENPAPVNQALHIDTNKVNIINNDIYITKKIKKSDNVRSIDQNEQCRDDTQSPTPKKIKKSNLVNYKPSERLIELAKEKGWEDPNLALEEFKDYHVSRGTKLKDVEAALRTWLRNGLKYKKQGARNGQHARPAGLPPKLQPWEIQELTIQRAQEEYAKSQSEQGFDNNPVHDVKRLLRFYVD